MFSFFLFLVFSGLCFYLFSCLALLVLIFVNVVSMLCLFPPSLNSSIFLHSFLPGGMYILLCVSFQESFLTCLRTSHHLGGIPCPLPLHCNSNISCANDCNLVDACQKWTVDGLLGGNFKQKKSPAVFVQFTMWDSLSSVYMKGLHIGRRGGEGTRT